MKSAGQFFLGILSAIGTSLLVLSAASLALVEGGSVISNATLPGATAALPTAVEVTNASGSLETLTPTAVQVQPTACPTPEGWTRYVVQPGDTLEAIAAQAGIDLEQVQKANCLAGTSLFPNTTLFLPVPEFTSTPENLPTPLPTLEPTLEPSATFPPVIIPTRCGPPAGWVPYVVQYGDTLYHLSVVFGVPQDWLRSANCMSGTGLKAGQTLYVPFIAPTRTPAPSRTPTSAPPPATATTAPTAAPPTDTPQPTNTSTPTSIPTPTDTATPAPSATPTEPNSPNPNVPTPTASAQQ